MYTAKSKKGGAVPRNRRNRNGGGSTNGAPRGALAMVPHLSECTEKYAKALCAPFIPNEGVCIPDTITVPSMKVAYSCKGSFAVGTQGFGFAALNPWLMVQQGATLNATGSNASVIATNATYGLVTTPVDFTSTNIGTTCNAFRSNSSFSNTALLAAGGHELRLCGSGLRVRYTGTELNRSGRIVCYRTRTNEAVQTLFSTSDALSDAYFHTSPVDRTWKQVTYQPTRAEDLSYHTFTDPSVSGVATDQRCLVIMIDAAGASNTFEFEAVSYFELVTRSGLLPAPPTMSHSDPAGVGAVLSSFPNKLIATGSELLTTVKNGAMKALTYATSGLVMRGLQAVGTSLFGPVGGAMGTLAGAGAQRFLTGPTVSEVD